MQLELELGQSSPLPPALRFHRMAWSCFFSRRAPQEFHEDNILTGLQGLKWCEKASSRPFNNACLHPSLRYIRA